ncbi:MAG: DUF1656 domain-containing protein [Rhodospirillales bacterium]
MPHMHLLPFSLEMPDLFGFYVPPLLMWLMCALPPYALLLVGLRRIGFYRAVWHAALFNMALYVAILCALILTVGEAGA